MIGRSIPPPRIAPNPLLAGTPLAHTTELPTEPADSVIEPLLFAQSFYRAANALSLARGHDPDAPPHLHKVTETL